jgi:hypothetical protein
MLINLDYRIKNILQANSVKTTGVVSSHDIEGVKKYEEI